MHSYGHQNAFEIGPKTNQSDQSRQIHRTDWTNLISHPVRTQFVRHISLVNLFPMLISETDSFTIACERQDIATPPKKCLILLE